MLKGKIQELLLKDLENPNKIFEIINEDLAMQIVGGDCTELQSCLNYVGNCSALANCHNFIEK